MKYIAFDKSAIEYIASTKEMQSIEFAEGKLFIDIIRGTVRGESTESLYINYSKTGLFFVGAHPSKSILVFDLEQSEITQKETNDDNLLLAFQKTFRTAIRIWHQQPFTSSERMHGTKSIIFPYVFSDRRRVVIERSPNSERLTKRGIIRPLLIYKYGVEDAPRVEELPSVKNLEDAGEELLAQNAEIIRHFRSFEEKSSDNKSINPLIHESSNEHVGDGGFKYLNYETQLQRLTTTQKAVVENKNIASPIRIEGPAGTGKTASMILRSYRILEEKRKDGIPYKILYVAHSESTKQDVYNSFSLLENSSLYLEETAKQKIQFTTLFNYCINSLGLTSSEVIENDAAEAKQTQKLLIAEAADTIISSKYKTYKPVLSEEFNKLFDERYTPKGVLVSLLQHEFSVQIKGRTDGSIEEYLLLSPIPNALPARSENEKKFVYSIFQEYQRMLAVTNVYDNDDITVAALSKWNTPIWRRERLTQGFDYLFVDEMHLFSLNEQHTFHCLTKDLNQKNIPICFALDYSQAIGDRGDISQDYIEKVFGESERNNYKTVFRSSQQITDFCAAIAASGALMFQSNYRNPYDAPASGFTSQEEAWCFTPELHMYGDDDAMMGSLKQHIEKCKKDLQCKNSEIAIISFEDSLLYPEKIEALSQNINSEILVLRDRETVNVRYSSGKSDPIVLSSPYNVNGLEFKCVILVGVDEGRVPQNVGVTDISANYIKYSAFNQLYLTSSRAKFRLILIGNSLHGVSSCLQYAIENERLEVSTHN